jgi:5-(carboxyamino)imidazole ribonucleotide synthase
LRARDSRPRVVGVVGGGQLARMMYQAAIPLGIDLRILTAGSADSAARVAADVTVGDWHDPDVLRRFAAGCDVITFDHELVDAVTVELIEASGAVVRPGAAALRDTADKARQRALCVSLGIAVPRHVVATGTAELVAAAAQIGYPAFAKLARGGYDGRGVFALGDEGDTLSLRDRLPADTVVVVEPELALSAELATQVARRADGTMVHYPLVQTHQVDGICRGVAVPTPLSAAFVEQAQTWAATIADATGVTGVLAVEFFVTDGALMVNELAPRPHNSGHYTIDPCVTSQFENHLRAVLDLPLGATDLVVPAAAMVNLIVGRTALPDLERLAADPRARIHLYAKDSREGRKVGHVTMCGSDAEILMAEAAALCGEPPWAELVASAAPGRSSGLVGGSDRTWS